MLPQSIVAGAFLPEEIGHGLEAAGVVGANALMG